MSIKTFYIALYMLELETKNGIFNMETVIAEFQNLFTNDERFLNFRNDLGLKDLIIYRWKKIFFFILIGNQRLLIKWSLTFKNSLENLLNSLFLNGEYEHFFLEDCTYLRLNNSRRLGSVGSALRRIIRILREREKKKGSAILGNVDSECKNGTLEEDRTDLGNVKYDENIIYQLNLCLILDDTKEKRQKMEEILLSVTENRKIPQLDLRYYALYEKKQIILSKVESISEENINNTEKLNLNKKLKVELKELVKAI